MDIDANDLTLSTKQGLLNIRVLLIIETPSGYIFEKHEDGYHFAIGGRVKFNETSLDAARRELREEIDNEDLELEFKGLIENFFTARDTKYHEINFVYYGKLEQALEVETLHSDHTGFVYIDAGAIDNSDIKPRILLKALSSDKEFKHLINVD